MLCWLDLQEQAKPSLQRLVLDKLEFRFTMFLEVILLKNMQVLVLQESDHCLMRPKKILQALFLLMKLMQSERNVTQVHFQMSKETIHWTNCLSEWMGLKQKIKLLLWEQQTGKICLILLYFVQEGLTEQSRLMCQTSRKENRFWKFT